MQVRDTAEAVPTDTGKTRDGEMDDKVMLEGREGSRANYRLLIEQPRTDWTTPRHRHDFDQVRYPIRGEFNYAPGKYLKQGYVGYFPEGVYYGPQVKPAGGKLALFQFGSASGNGYSSNRQKKAMYEKMLQEGKFEGGVYTWVDAEGRKHNQDAAEARRERIVGKKMNHRPRYEDLIIMNPENYDWVDDRAQPGVAHKWLASFTERGPRVGFARIAPGATLTVGRHQGCEMMLVLSGKVEILGRTHGVDTAISTEPKEGPLPIKAAQASELIYLQLPVFE